MYVDLIYEAQNDLTEAFNAIEAVRGKRLRVSLMLQFMKLLDVAVVEGREPQGGKERILFKVTIWLDKELRSTSKIDDPKNWRELKYFQMRHFVNIVQTSTEVIRIAQIDDFVTSDKAFEASLREQGDLAELAHYLELKGILLSICARSSTDEIQINFRALALKSYDEAMSIWYFTGDKRCSSSCERNRDILLNGTDAPLLPVPIT